MKGKIAQNSDRNFETKMKAGYDYGFFKIGGQYIEEFLGEKNVFVMIKEFKNRGGIYKIKRR